MSSKIGTILSLIFVVFFMLLGADMMSIQYIYADLDAKGTTISYLISKHGTVDDSIVETIQTTYNVVFECLSYCDSAVGDTVTFQISTTFNPIIMSKSDMTITVQRQAVIGYYG